MTRKTITATPPAAALSPARSPDLSPDLSHVETWVFDLDNTLYPAECNLFAQVDRRMTEFIADFLGLSRDEARRLQKEYFRAHGTTLNGLMAVHGLAPAAFLDYVHDIDVSPVDPCPELDRILHRLPGRKLIYTNGSTAHAERVLARLGVERHFDDIFDIVAAGYVPKPNAAPYAQLVARGCFAPRGAVMFDDIAKNLRAAFDLGMTTVWIRTESAWSGAPGPDEPLEHVHHVAEDLLSFLRALPAMEGVAQDQDASRAQKAS